MPVEVLLRQSQVLLQRDHGATGNPGAPAAPTGLGHSSVADHTATLTWSASSGATSYRVTLGGVLQSSQAGTTFNATGLTSGTKYTWTVTATNASGTSAPSSVDTFTTTGTPPLVKQWAGQVPGRCIVGMRCREAGGSNLNWPDAINIFSAHSPAMANRIYARREYAAGWFTTSKGSGVVDSDVTSRLNGAITDGVTTLISFKVPGTDWAGVTAGSFDSDLAAFHAYAVSRHASHPSEIYLFSVHHEPANTAGHTLLEWSAMQTYLSNYFADLKAYAVYCPIGNGFWFGKQAGAHVQDVLDAFPASLITAINANGGIIMADCYDSADPINDPPTKDHTHFKVQGLIDWGRSNGVKSLGMGEWGCGLGTEVDSVWNVIKNNTDIMSWATYFNSGGNSRADWRLIPNGYPPDPTTSFPDTGGTSITQARLDRFAVAAIAAQYVYIGGVQQ